MVRSPEPLETKRRTFGAVTTTFSSSRSDRAEKFPLLQPNTTRSSPSAVAPEEWGVDLYLKDESTHPTGSLKHRLARSLFLHALCNGWVRRGRPVIEASSGSTAVSEAYFARLIGVPFIAVMAQGTSRDKIRLIELHGGRCHFVERPDHWTSGSRGRG